MSKSDLYRILIPSEYQALRDVTWMDGKKVVGIRSKHRILIDTMLFTGMRYEELKDFAGLLYGSMQETTPYRFLRDIQRQKKREPYI